MNFESTWKCQRSNLFHALLLGMAEMILPDYRKVGMYLLVHGIAEMF